MTVDRRKVLFLIPSLAGGGAERVFSILLCHLDRSRFEPHLAILQAHGAYMRDIPPDVAVHNLNVSRVRYALPRIVRLVWKIRPQSLISTLGHLNLALSVATPFLPSGTRLLVREAAIASAALLDESAHPQFSIWLYRHLYRRADAVICLSDSMKNDMIVNFSLPPEKLVRIYNPVDIRRVRAASEIGKNPFCGPGPNLVAAGRLTREKGFDVLLDAMPAVLERFPKAQLTILGEGPLRADLMKQAQELGLNEVVTFPGFQPNPWVYLKHADLFVLSSRYEGLPNVILEALALGTPLVVTDCPGAIREIQDCDESMVVVPPENSVALAEGIIAACSRPSRSQMVKSQLSLSKFDLNRIVGEYSALF
ncbi:MAG: glycosyltransferase [Acidobacteriia bacterium]|nr:glycosyltransferase [Terriglobia bacterium]